MDQEVKDSILRAAIAAPSADNSQPWRFAWRDDALDLRIDPGRSGGVSDGRFVLSDLASGACLENVLIAARELGYSGDVRILPDSRGDPRWIAHIHWRRDQDRGAAPLAGAISARHTDRRFPWSGPIDADVWSRLAREAATIDGARLWRAGLPAERGAARRIIRRAESLRFRSAVLHRELFGSIRFDVGWRTSSAEGLAPATLAVEPPLRAAFAAMRRPAVMATLNRVGGAAMLGWRSAWLPIRLSPGLALVVVRSGARSDVIAGGRALQRVWLAATLAGLAVQPYAAAGVLGLGFVPVEHGFRPLVESLAASLRELCAGQGLVFLRLGLARSTLRVRSGRRQLADFAPFE